MSALLTLKGLSVSGRLHQVDLEIRQGEFVGLIGPNGAGKTTLLRASLGLIKSTGSSSLLEKPVSSRPAHVAYLPQDRGTIWPISCREVLELGRRANPEGQKDAPARAEAMLQRMGLSQFAHRALSQLSGGEKAKVLLARALAQGAPLLLADEPCAALDPAQALQTAKLMRHEAQSGRAVLASLHDLPLAAKYCTRLIVMKCGQVVANGPPEDVLTPALCRKVFGIGIKRHHDDWVITE